MSKEQFLSDIETLVSDFSKGKQRYDWGTLESGLKVAFMRSLEPVPLAAQASPAPEREYHEQKWRRYEQKYILPCFTWAKEYGIDLEKLVREQPGKNCVELLIRALAPAACSGRGEGEER